MVSALPLSLSAVAGRLGPGRLRALGVAALAVLVALCYVPALRAGFVWDDRIFTDARAVSEWGDIWRIWLDPRHIQAEAHYWPMPYSSFWVEHKLWGFNPAGYHAVNVGLHLANTLLVWHLMRRLQVPGAWLAAAVFAVHPVHVDSVAWVIERKDMLSALFYLGAVAVWLRFRRTATMWSYLAVVALLAAGMLSKSIVVTLPAALLIVAWWQTGRLSRSDVLPTIPLFVVALGIALADYVHYAGLDEPRFTDLTMVERSLIAARSLWFYASKLLWPSDLAVIYPHWEVDAASLAAWGLLAAAVAVAAALWLLRGRIGRGPLAGALFFAVTLSPVLGFISFSFTGFSFVADRFQYLASIGATAVAVAAAARGAARLPERLKPVAAAAAVAVLAVFGALSWRQASVYHSDETYFRHVIGHNPHALGAHVNLSMNFIEEERFEDALEAARYGLGFELDAADIVGLHESSGLALAGLERPAEAERHYRTALDLEPERHSAMANLAVLLADNERYGEAIDLMGQAVRGQPGDSLRHMNMGRIEQKRGNYQQAEGHFRQALRIDPRTDRWDHDMGSLSIDLERYAEAEDHLRRAVAADPDDAAVHVDLGVALYHLGDEEAAAASYRRALELEPGQEEALANLRDLGNTRNRPGPPEELLAAAQQAIERDPGNALEHVNAAIASEELGRRAQAEEYYRLALGIDPSHEAALLNLGSLLYDAGQFDRSLEAYSDAAAHYPDNPEAALGLGTAHYGLRDYRAAEENFRRVLELDPAHGRALNRLGVLRLDEERFREALEFFRRAAEAEPASAKNHSDMGVALAYLGRDREAIRSFERALELDPALASARQNLETVQRRLG